MKKINLALIFGGQSAEHAVSLESGKNVMDALDQNKYQTHLIAIDKSGAWRHIADPSVLRKTDVAAPIDVERAGARVFLVPTNDGVQILNCDSREFVAHIDCVFPILHGPYGEDGSMQGYLRILGVPYVGVGVLGSAVGMDKDVAKRLLRDAGLPIGKFLCFEKHDQSSLNFAEIKRQLGLPFFLKPANMGSSVGVHKVSDESSFTKATADAFDYDTKVLFEEFIDGREIECSVLGNHEVSASEPGEILPQHDFYSYEAKYLDENGAKLKIPADLTRPQAENVRKMAMQVFKTFCCEGMGRVDFFMTKDNHLIVNEINTIPGFTKISMYPKMWANSGIAYSSLIDRLIDLAFARFKEEKSLKR